MWFNCFTFQVKTWDLPTSEKVFVISHTLGRKPRAWWHEEYCFRLILIPFISQSSFPVIHKVGHVNIFILCKFKNITDREIYYTIKIQIAMKKVNLYWNTLDSLLFLIYLHKKLYKNANVVNFVYYGKTRLSDIRCYMPLPSHHRRNEHVVSFTTWFTDGSDVEWFCYAAAYIHWGRWTKQRLFKKNWMTLVLFVGPLIALFCIWCRLPGFTSLNVMHPSELVWNLFSSSQVGFKSRFWLHCNFLSWIFDFQGQNLQM